MCLHRHHHFEHRLHLRLSGHDLRRHQDRPGAIATLYIDALLPAILTKQAVLEIIKKIEALKPIDLLTAADEQSSGELLAEYNALTDAQKELVFNYQTLLDAIEQVGPTPSAQM